MAASGTELWSKTKGESWAMSGFDTSVTILLKVIALSGGSNVQKYDFWFQVWTGIVIIIVSSFLAMGISVPTVEDGKITEAGQPLWISFVYQGFAFPGLIICMYAYWRARKRAANLGLFFLCWSAYFSIGLVGIRQAKNLDNPSTASFLLMILATGMLGAALFVLDYIMVKRFGLKSDERQSAFTDNPATSLTGTSAVWKFVVGAGRLLLFFICLFLSLIAVHPRLVHEDWPRVVVFLFVLLLSCLISGLISEDTIPKFLSLFKINLSGRQ